MASLQQRKESHHPASQRRIHGRHKHQRFRRRQVEKSQGQMVLLRSQWPEGQGMAHIPEPLLLPGQQRPYGYRLEEDQWRLVLFCQERRDEDRHDQAGQQKVLSGRQRQNADRLGQTQRQVLLHVLGRLRGHRLENCKRPDLLHEQAGRHADRSQEDRWNEVLF